MLQALSGLLVGLFGNKRIKITSKVESQVVFSQDGCDRKVNLPVDTNIIVLGMTGYGKSVGVMNMLYSIMDNYSPEEFKVAYIDGKGHQFELMDNNPFAYTEPVNADKDIGLACVLVKHIRSQLYRRIELFSKLNIQDIDSYNAAHPKRKLPRILLVINEFTVLTSQDNVLEEQKLAGEGTIRELEYIANNSAKYGVNLLLINCSVRMIPSTILEAITSRVIFRVADSVETEIALPNEDAQRIVMNLHPGEFYDRLSPSIEQKTHHNCAIQGKMAMITGEDAVQFNEELKQKYSKVQYIISHSELMVVEKKDRNGLMSS